MHRTNHVPRLLGTCSLLIGVLLGTSPASAQDVNPIQFNQGPGDRPDVSVLQMTTGTTKVYTTKENLKRVENPNPKVLNVQRVAYKFNEVLFEAMGPGRARVTLTDQKDHVEYVDVIVISDRVKELRDLLQRSVPTGAVIVNSTDSGNNVILTGYVKNDYDAKVVQAIAGQLFGANVINNVQIGDVQQVQLEVVIAVVNRSEARNMAFSFMENRNQGYIASIFGPATLASSLATSVMGGNANFSSSGGNIPFGILGDRNSFFGWLQALRAEGLTKILAEPRVVTLSGRPANFVSGGEVPQLTSSGQGAPSISYKQFGTVIRCLPIVLGNGKIHLEVNPEISAPDASLGITIASAVTPTSVTGFRTRSVQVAVQIEDGQTLAIGGLIQNDINATISRVPILGDLPFIGVAFTSKSYTEQEQELLILVTPRLVDPVDCCKIPKWLPGRETRSPDDFEFFLEGIMEAPRGQRNVALHPYKPAFLSSPSYGQYPCNDASGCHNGNCNNGNCNSCAGGNCGIPSGMPIANGNGNGGSFVSNGVSSSNGISGNTGAPAAVIRPVPQSKPLTTVAPNRAPMPVEPEIRLPMPPVREQTTPGAEIPLPSPTRQSLPGFPSVTSPLSSNPPLPTMPTLPSANARELENRPVLPPIPLGPANTDQK